MSMKLKKFEPDCLVCLCRQPIDNLTPEERDARTVFCMQLAARIRPRDLEEFFSAVGKVNTDHRMSTSCYGLLFLLKNCTADKAPL